MKSRIIRTGFGKRKEGRSGAAAVEMALVLPIFMMVVMGIIEFGRAMMVSQLITNAARYGVRLAIVDGSTNAAVTTAIQTFLTQTTSVAATNVTVTITVTPAAGNPSASNLVENALPKDLCAVSISVPFSKVALTAGTYLKTTNLRGACTMPHE